MTGWELHAAKEAVDAPELVHRGQPWSDAVLASLYDAFPFDADIPYYLDLASRHDGPVLELGCGTGRLMIPLALAGHRVVGLDASAAMLTVARRKLEAASVGDDAARLVRGNFSSFQLPERFGLAILAVHTFAYVVDRRDQQRTLTAVAEHLQPGGHLVLDLLNPSPAWLLEPRGSLRQDLFEELRREGMVVTRTETVVDTDLAAQVRVIRSAYEMVTEEGVTKRFVEWPLRYTYRFEAEHLLERCGFEVEAVHGGYRREPFTSGSPVLLLVARRR